MLGTEWGTVWYLVDPRAYSEVISEVMMYRVTRSDRDDVVSLKQGPYVSCLTIGLLDLLITYQRAKGGSHNFRHMPAQ